MLSFRHALLPLLFACLFAGGAIAQTDTTRHTTQLVPVDKDVRLEVVDWGGSGRPLVFLAGFTDTAHIFDAIAPKFAAHYHVYGITRRGYGASSKPDPATSDYSADRLGEDVVAVLDALKLQHPVLIGHSFAGEEMSAIAAHHPDKVAGLIYMDAGYTYAFDGTPGAGMPLGSGLTIDARALREALSRLQTWPLNPDPIAMTEIQTLLPRVEKELAAAQAMAKSVPPGPSAPAEIAAAGKIEMAILNGVRRYTAIPVPVLAFFVPEPPAPEKADARAHAITDLSAKAKADQADAFAASVPTARIVRLPGADHHLWKTNEADLLRETDRFIAGLK